MYSAEERIKIWREFLKCKPDPVVKRRITDMTIKTYTKNNGDEVVYCMLHGVGHAIPRSVSLVMDELIMDFFMKHERTKKSQRR
jgi:poly(3-hydroxybutyrate) depolymerase